MELEVANLATEKDLRKAKHGKETAKIRDTLMFYPLESADARLTRVSSRESLTCRAGDTQRFGNRGLENCGALAAL